MGHCKRTARKPRSKGEVKKTANQSKATHSEKRYLKNKIKVSGVKESEDCECPYCLERFTKAVKQKKDWIKCDKCKRWCHEVCTEYSGENASCVTSVDEIGRA